MRWNLAYKLFAVLRLVMLAPNARANDSAGDVELIQIGAYQAVSIHFVWSSALSSECKISPTMYFDGAKPSGKALIVTLMAALFNKLKQATRWLAAASSKSI